MRGVVVLVWVASYELICPDTVWEGEPVSTWAQQLNAQLELLLGTIATVATTANS